jgi:dTDP-glucose 4,6-dehydratase
MIKIALIGAGGFILSNLIRSLLYKKEQYNIVSIDKFQDERQLNNIYINKGNKFYIADVGDTHIIRRIFQIERPDIVINGSCSGCVQSILDNESLINVSKEIGVSKFVFLSHYNVYGSTLKHSAPTEDENLLLNNLYNISFSTCEQLVNISGLDYLILRLCDNIGSRQRHGIVPQIIQNINKEVKTKLSKNIDNHEFIHVTDTCDAISLLLDLEKEGIYNISSSYEFSLPELYTEICNVMGKGHDLVEYFDDKKSVRYVCSSDKLKKECNWELTFKFKDAVKASVQWYLDNAWFLRE